MIALLLTLLPTCAPQTGNVDDPPAADPRTAAAEEWDQFDGVAAVLDGRPITWRALDAEVRRTRGDQRFTDAAEQIQAIREATTELLRSQLYAAAGRELDVPLDRLRTQIALGLEDERQELGNLGFAEKLRERGSDPLEELRKQEDEALGMAWLRGELGYASFARERPIVDRYLRPGELRAYYQLEAERMADPAKVQLQVLALPYDAWGGPDIARDQLSALLAERDAGNFGEAEFTAAVEEYGAFLPERRGYTGLEPIPALSQMEGSWASFLSSAEAGQISGVLTYSRLPGRNSAALPEGVCLLRVVQQQEGQEPPSFRQRDFQSLLRRALGAQRDNTRAARTIRRRLGRSYVWVTPGLEGAVEALAGK